MGEAKNAVPPYTWSGIRPAIIITANLLPSMLGAGMHGMHGRNLPEQELEGVVNVGEVLHCLEEKEKTES